MTQDLQEDPLFEMALGARPIMGRAATQRVSKYIAAIIARVRLMWLLAWSCG